MRDQVEQATTILQMQTAKSAMKTFQWPPNSLLPVSPLTPDPFPRDESCSGGKNFLSLKKKRKKETPQECLHSKQINMCALLAVKVGTWSLCLLGTS
jgi:hypothetical protein